MNRNWSARRKFSYAGAVVMVFTLAFAYSFRETLFPHPTCFDNKQNGFESGIDCGGACSLRCSQEVIPLSVSWSTLSKTSSTTYDLIGYVSNKNLDNVPHEMGYAFIVYDAEGREMSRIPGTTVVPLGDFPIIYQNATFPITPNSITLTLSNNVKHYKVNEQPTDTIIRVSDTKFENGSIPRVSTKVTNMTRQVFRNVPVRVVLYDVDGNAFAGGETTIPEIGKEEVENVVFTWKRAFQDPPVKVRVLPILDPFLGVK